jgi:transposase
MSDAMLDARQEMRFVSSYRGDYGAAPPATVDGAGEGPDRSGELRGGRQHFRGCTPQWCFPWAAYGVATKGRGGGGVNAAGFVPVRIASEGGPATVSEPGRLTPAHTKLPEMASPPGQLSVVIEIEVSGARIRVEPGVNPTTLSTALSAVVSEALRANPCCGDVFVFRSKRKDRVKLLAWDGSGMVLVTKWLHQGGFTGPPVRDGVVYLSATQLTPSAPNRGRLRDH